MDRALAIRRECGASPVRSSSTRAERSPTDCERFHGKMFDALHGECIPGRGAKEQHRSQRKVSDQLLATMRSVPVQDRVMTCPYFQKLVNTRTTCFFEIFFYFSQHLGLLDSITDSMSEEGVVPTTSAGEENDILRGDTEVAEVGPVDEACSNAHTGGSSKCSTYDFFFMEYLRFSAIDGGKRELLSLDDSRSDASRCRVKPLHSRSALPTYAARTSTFFQKLAAVIR
jgi:hypothetical protein